MKVKKWLLGLVTFTAMVVICAVCAGAETYGDFEYSVRDDGTVEITDYNGNAKTVDIPETIDGKSATRIGDSAFEWCSNIESIAIPDSVTSIGRRAFGDCANLTNITIPNSVIEIGWHAFYDCASLKSITIPDSVINIGGCAFNNCTSLTSVTIPDSVTSIEYSAFVGCTSLTAINVATGNQNYASVNDVLYNKNKTTLMCYPAGKKDKTYKMLDGVKIIDDSAFDGCISLTSIIIPDSVTSIGSSAFSGCTNLMSITIPDSVTDIGNYVFEDCTNITAINVATGNQNYVSVNGVLYNKNKTTIKCYPAGKKDKTYKMLDGVKIIDDSAFDGCISLTSITIPDGVTNIDCWAFSDCTSLTSIVIPDSVMEIGWDAFNGCTSLTSIAIPGSVTEIADGTFWDCESLTSITIPDGVISIGNSAFQNCKNLTSITIPDGAISIGSYAFMNCESLVSITIPGSVSKIGWWAFSECTSLTSIAIPDSVTEIDVDTFRDCESLTSVTIPDGVIRIGNIAFLNCASLVSITIPSSVTSIGDYALGFYIDYNTYNYAKYDNFKIYCYSGTAGEQYAKDNGFDYELITAEKPANVTGFKVKSIFSTNVTLQWNKNANASGYEIEQYKDGKWVNVAKITSNATTSYTVKGLAAGTAGYKFRMRAVKNGAYSDYTSALSVNTNPYGVGGFKCSSKTSTSVTLKWNKGTTASGYQLQQYKDGKWVTIYTGTKATNTSYTVKNLKAGTAGYRFRIRAYKTYGNTKQYGSWSSEVKVNTNPYGVGGFKCSSKTSTSVTLKWNKGTTASGYQLQQYKDGKWVTIYTGTKATNTSYTVKGLKAGTAGYRFRIRAYKTYGNTKQYGSWSSEVKVNTNPYGVSGFKCSSKTSTSVTLKWNKGTTASGYQLQQYKDGKWVTIYTGTKATSTSYTVKGLKAGTAGYRFRIRAYKTYGNTKQYGSWSSEVKVNTNPYGVGGFKVKATTKNSITLGWNKGTTASGYQLQQYKDGKWVTVYTGTKATSTSCTIKSLKANTSYKFRIRAYKTYGNTKQYGSWSKELTVRTKR
jgi:hypothetical protein